MLVDTHCHLEDYSEEEILKLATSEMIIIASGANRETNKRVVELVNNNDNIYGTIGIQPTEVKNMDTADLDYIDQNLSNPKIVGIGEVGLDYYWDDSNKEEQKEIFIKQIYLAKKHKKTLVIHSRESIKDVLEILTTHLGDNKAVLHCFSGDYETANKLSHLNIKFGIGGIVTFKNAFKLREVVLKLPIEKIVLETDAPYLSPMPYRGQTNTPLNLKFIAEEIAKIKEANYWEIVKKTGQNALEQFDLQ